MNPRSDLFYKLYAKYYTDIDSHFMLILTDEGLSISRRRSLHLKIRKADLRYSLSVILAAHTSRAIKSTMSNYAVPIVHHLVTFKHENHE